MTCGCGLGRGARGREFSSTRSNPPEDPTLIAYRAILDVPRELVLELAKLLRAERRSRGTRKGTRLLTCFRQALLVLVWLRTKGEVEVIGAGFGVPRATAYRYRGPQGARRPSPRPARGLAGGGRTGLVARTSWSTAS